MKKLIILLVLTLVFIASCSKNPNEPVIEDINPYNFQIAFLEDDLIELSWENTSENSSILISRKYGELDWDNDYLSLDSDTSSVTDTVPTESHVIISYFLSEISEDEILGVSDTLAWISSHIFPTEFSVEQIFQDSVKLSWRDNSYGELVYNLDKRVDGEEWQINYMQIEPDQHNGYNTILSCYDNISGIDDSVFYRIQILNGSSGSAYSEASIYTEIYPPLNLTASIEGESIRLNWVNNYQMIFHTIIERKHHGGEYDVVDELTNNEITWIDSEIDPSQIYCYRLKLQAEEFESEYSNVVIGNINHSELWVPLDYPTIQSAINAIEATGEILILPGTYHENLQVTDKVVSLLSLYSLFSDYSYIERTIIDGGDIGSVLSMTNCNQEMSLISGITIQSGSGTLVNAGGNFNWFYGGGILLNNSNIQISNSKIQDNNSQLGGGLACLLNSSCEIENTEIENNSAVVNLNYGGGGILCDESTLTIENSSVCNNFTSSDGGGMLIVQSIADISNTIVNSNTSYRLGGGISMQVGSEVNLENLTINDNFAHRKGGGLYSAHTSPVMRNLTICNNSATLGGGGVYFSSCQIPVFENIILAGNTSEFGGGVYLNSAHLTLTNVTAYDNIASSGGGALYARHYGYSTIINTIFWNNSPQEIMIRPGNEPSVEGTVTILYSDIDGGVSEISATDLSNIYWLEGNLILDPIFQNELFYNFHLHNNSPCIDSGDPDPLYNDIDGSRNDMGAYGGPNAEL